MADTKITQLQPPQLGYPVVPATDVLPIVVIADPGMATSGSTRKITVNQLLGAGGTATLASATITGDLTVKTNVLKVDTTNNRVGIGTASPSVPLHILNNTAATNTAVDVLLISQTSTGTPASGLGGGLLFRSQRPSGGLILNRGAIYGVSGADPDDDGDLAFYTLTNTGASGFTEKYRLDSNGVATWSNVGGVAGTAMTLNATGLGVGGAPVNPLTVFAASSAKAPALLLSTAGSPTYGWDFSVDGAVNGNLFIRSLVGGTKTDVLEFDRATGNVGIGVTPSAWTTSYNALNIGSGGSIAAYKSANYDQLYVGSNFFENTSGAWRFINNGYATQYWHNSGSHVWRISTTSNAAGANQPLTWTQAMTLDASGNLLVGTTGVSSAFNTKFHISSDSGTTKWAVGPYSSASNFVISAAGGGGVYLNGTAATSWTSASDERLKDIIEPISNAIAKVGSLRAVIGKFKFDQNNTRKPFLIAQDIQAVLPEAVDASNPDQLGVAYTEVIPLLVAAIKELTSRVQTLETR